MEEFLKKCEASVLKGDKALAADLATTAIDKQYNLLNVIDDGFAKGIRAAGDLWDKGEYFLPELAFSAEAMKNAMEILQPALLEDNEATSSRGTAVIGTIQGDIHDIGKTLVATMLAANGYNVVDLGADVAYERFVEEVGKQKADLLCMSALLTTTMAGQGTVIDQLAEKGLRTSTKVLVGGAPLSESFARDIGADGFADNAVSAVQEANSLLS